MIPRHRPKNPLPAWPTPCHPTMAMFIGPDRKTVIAQVRAATGPLQIQLGRGIPSVVIEVAEGDYRVTTLIIDEEAERRFLSAGPIGTYLPEMRMRFQKRGKVLHQGSDRAALIAFLQGFRWFRWP